MHRRPPMANFSARPNNFWYRFFSNQRFLAIIGLGFLLFLAFPLARTYSQRRIVEREIIEMKKQISDYEAQNQQLKELASYLQSDQSLEEQARVNLNLKKPGEEVIVIEDAKNMAVQSDVADNASEVSNLVKWWQYYFN